MTLHFSSINCPFVTQTWKHSILSVQIQYFQITSLAHQKLALSPTVTHVSDRRGPSFTQDTQCRCVPSSTSTTFPPNILPCCPFCFKNSAKKLHKLIFTMKYWNDFPQIRWFSLRLRREREGTGNSFSCHLSKIFEWLLSPCLQAHSDKLVPFHSVEF